MKIRRRAREMVLQCLYELDFTAHSFESAFKARLEYYNLPQKGVGFGHRLGLSVTRNREKLDHFIIKLAPEWPIDQIASIDRNILRIAIFEMVSDSDVPPKVAINEAVELAKRFGSDSSPRFVNGVLGALAKPQQKSASPAKTTTGQPVGVRTS